MAEYIEREAVEKFIEDGLNNQDVAKRFGHDAIEIMAEVHYMPAADVAEVRHGRWIELDECANEGVYCSVCHKKVYKIDYAWSNNPVKMKSPYCPNCGARMDKEDAEGGRG